MSKAKNRTLVTDVWGVATAGSVAESILLGSTRNISRMEKLIGGAATGTTGTVTAKRLSWEGVIDHDEIELIRGS